MVSSKTVEVLFSCVCFFVAHPILLVLFLFVYCIHYFFRQVILYMMILKIFQKPAPKKTGFSCLSVDLPLYRTDLTNSFNK